jgi:hypothetical protein
MMDGRPYGSPISPTIRPMLSPLPHHGCQDLGPDFLPSFYYGDLRDYDTEGRRPSGFEPSFGYDRYLLIVLLLSPRYHPCPRPFPRRGRDHRTRETRTEALVPYPAFPCGFTPRSLRRSMDLLGANVAFPTPSPLPTHCSQSSPQPCPGRSDRGPNVLPSFSLRDLRGSLREGQQPSGCECRRTEPLSELSHPTGDPLPPPFGTRPYPQPCSERSGLGPDALPSFSRRDLRGSNHEGQLPSGCEPFSHRMSSARMPRAPKDPFLPLGLSQQC